MTPLETILSVFGIIGIACWPVTVRDFRRLYAESIFKGTGVRTRRAFIALPLGSMFLALGILGSGLIHGNEAAVVIGVAYAVIDGAVAVVIGRYRVS